MPRKKKPCYDAQFHMSWILFSLSGHSTREPASAVCDDEQGGPLYFADTQKPASATVNTEKKSGKVMGKNESE